ncbi:hypothetical protein QQ008_28230 [Fulvivirgaceae bacterium BMA10]|uniref:SRPBCC domain-containing protein n=1 Tax=Splendidivirga corallicola TaxID=3051826 RepID=A0ABT8L102_9BACT|nr:hypothetical protein [Fulvivirgaceae bacterium BMA10]
MKNCLTILMIMTTTSISMAQDGRAQTNKKTFSRQTAVSTNIAADASIIWTLLTNGADISRWNSTIVSFEGDIVQGEKIKLKSIVDPSRVFTIKVKSVKAENEMVWADGTAPFFRGVRTFSLKSNPDGTNTFSMIEKMGGLMYPMAAKHIPDFDDSFEQFAADLKREAELIQNSKN